MSLPNFKISLNSWNFLRSVQQLVRQFVSFTSSPILLVVNQSCAQKLPSRGVLKKRCSENMQQIYGRTPMPECDFNRSCLVNSLVLLLNVFRTVFPKSTSGGLLWRIFRTLFPKNISAGLPRYIFRTPFPKNTSGELPRCTETRQIAKNIMTGIEDISKLLEIVFL